MSGRVRVALAMMAVLATLATPLSAIARVQTFTASASGAGSCSTFQIDYSVGWTGARVNTVQLMLYRTAATTGITSLVEVRPVPLSSTSSSGSYSSGPGGPFAPFTVSGDPGDSWKLTATFLLVRRSGAQVIAGSSGAPPPQGPPAERERRLS